MRRIKGFGMIVQRPGVTKEYFHYHWRCIHSQHALRVKRFVNYVQFHADGRGLEPFAPAFYDGQAEVWYESLDAMATVRQDPARSRPLRTATCSSIGRRAATRS